MKNHKRCFNCLREGHLSKKSLKTKWCYYCKVIHNCNKREKKEALQICLHLIRKWFYYKQVYVVKITKLNWRCLWKPVIYLTLKYGIWLANAMCHFYFTIFKRYLITSVKARKEMVVFLVSPLKFMWNLSHLTPDDGLEWNIYEIIFNKVV